MDSESSTSVAKRASGGYAEATPAAQALPFSSPWDSRTYESSTSPEPLAMSLSGGTRLRKSIVSLTRRISTYDDPGNSGDNDSSSSSSSSGRSTPRGPEGESPGETGTEPGEETPQTEDVSGFTKESVDDANPVENSVDEEGDEQARYVPLESSESHGADVEHELHSRTLAASAGDAHEDVAVKAKPAVNPEPVTNAEKEVNAEAGSDSSDGPFADDGDAKDAADDAPRDSEAQEYVDMVREAMFGREGSLILKQRKPAVGEKRNSLLEQTADFLSQPRRKSMASTLSRGSASSDAAPRSKRISVVSMVLAPGATFSEASSPSIMVNGSDRAGKSGTNSNNSSNLGASANDTSTRKSSTARKITFEQVGESVDDGKNGAAQSGSHAGPGNSKSAELHPTPPPSKNGSTSSAHGPHHKRCVAQGTQPEQHRVSDASSKSPSDVAELDQTIPGQPEVQRAPGQEEEEEERNQESESAAGPVLEVHEEMASVSAGEIAEKNGVKEAADEGTEGETVAVSGESDEVAVAAMQDVEIESASVNDGDYDAAEPLPYLLGSTPSTGETTAAVIAPTPPSKKRSGSQVRVKVLRLVSGQEVYSAVHTPRRPLYSKAFYVAQQGMTKSGWQSVLTAQQNTLQELRTSRAAYQAFVNQLESIKRPRVHTAAAGED